MSPTPPNPVLDPSGHPPVETVAEYLEDLLPTEAAAELRAHLADCVDCADTLAALQEVRDLLGRDPAPALPDDIGIRIDAALAAEALLSAAPEPASAAPSSAPGLAPSPGKTSRAADGTSAAPGRPGGPSAPAGAGTGAARPPAGPGRGRSRRWRKAVLGLAALAVVGVVGTAVLQSGGESHNGSAKSASGAAVSPGGAPALPGLGTLTEANLPQQVLRLLPGAGAGPLHPQAQTGRANSPAAGTSPATGPATGAGANPADLPACVLAAVGRSGQEPAGAGRGVYQGTPVFALVYTDAGQPQGPVDAYLVDASCRGGVLLHRTVARG